jgi:hypothetical protein
MRDATLAVYKAVLGRPAAAAGETAPLAVADV